MVETRYGVAAGGDSNEIGEMKSSDGRGMKNGAFVGMVARGVR
jgi:hypothetical protein